MKTSNIPQISEWMLMSQDDVLNQFYSLNKAYSDGIGQDRFVFVPGTRDDRVLLVAHADTYWPEEKPEIGCYNSILFSRRRDEKIEVKSKSETSIIKNGMGIGADDRAGCALIWLLRNLGHSILITSGEEKGCIATKRLMKNEWWKKELNSTHSFAVQFDRRGCNDAVFYDVGTKKFVKFIQESTGFKPARGFSTDIKEICKDICGVNLSVGYYNEHTSEEQLYLDQLYNTFLIVKELLSKDKLDKFPLEMCDKYYQPYSSSQSSFDYGDDYGYSCYHNQYSYNKSTTNNHTSTIRKFDTSVLFRNNEQIIICGGCKTQFSEEEWYLNLFKCPHCKKEI